MSIQIRLRNVADGEALVRRASQRSAELAARHRFAEQIVSVEGCGPRLFEARIDTRWPERQVIVNADAAEAMQALEAAFERAASRLEGAPRRVA